MFDPNSLLVMHGLVFDYLGLLIAVLTIIQLVWNLFPKS